MYVIQILKPRKAMSRNARCAFLWVFLSDTALNYLLRPDLSILGYVKGVTVCDGTKYPSGFLSKHDTLRTNTEVNRIISFVTFELFRSMFVTVNFRDYLTEADR